MIVNFDSNIQKVLRELGYDVPFSLPTNIMQEFLLEKPCVVQGQIITDQPFAIGAFSGSYGGRHRAIKIGRYCSIAAGLETGWDGHPTEWASSSMVGYVDNIHNWAVLSGRPHVKPKLIFNSLKGVVEVGNDVWIGHSVFISPGVKIGDGAVVGSRAVVTQDVPAYAIVGGTPAKLIRYRFRDELIQKLLKLRWWDYNMYDLPMHELSNVETFVEMTESLIGMSVIEKYAGEKMSAKEISKISEGKL